MRLKLTALYLLLLIPSFLGAATLWTVAVSDRLYYCWDSVPLIDFIPPFVHPGVMLDSGIHDHYIAPARTVWSLWLAFVAAAFTLPLIGLRTIYRHTNHASRRATNVA